MIEVPGAWCCTAAKPNDGAVLRQGSRAACRGAQTVSVSRQVHQQGRVVFACRALSRCRDVGAFIDPMPTHFPCDLLGVPKVRSGDPLNCT